MQLYPVALVIATLLASHGYRKGSLSSSGALTAFVVGYISLANPIKAFGITLIAFYLTGSRATKVGHQIKQLLEIESHHIAKAKGNESNAKKHKSAQGGQRDAWQVLCNSFVSATAALLFRLLYENPAQWKDGKAWCFVLPDVIADNLITRHTPRFLVLLMIGHFACCMGDTLASELGILAKRPPRLILPPFKVVPPGTNGGLSVQGTLGSLIGGAFIGLIAGLTIVFKDNKACYAASSHILIKTVFLGGLGGIAGSGIDSLLGATLQRTWYNTKTKQVLLGRLPPANKTQNDWQVITGFDVLSNNSVNFISSGLTAILIAYLGNSYLF
ncbi:uncharacterized protein FA14DRAFT_124988 [Meira miltonrushii]|uniref:DUF92-domain-containing protein n=1 Tax=Meira miltonrushii TaxID=1280837 RepID=A0A316V8Z9_9BASI|nr:uncharacterized protein FA14DRAFT_124988 [Meira miltonrushii]PWN34079.1 hypothetical protein FA14DRAFT_124988 [Meira miltonrushii]